MNKQEQLDRAAELGKAAFHADKKCVPVWDKELVEIVKQGAPAADLFQAWSDAWHAENAKAPIYEVKRTFINGTLEGLSHTEGTPHYVEPGTVVEKPCEGGSGYRIDYCKRIDL